MSVRLFDGPLREMQRDYVRHGVVDALFHLLFGILFTFHLQYTNLSSWYPLAVQ